MHAWLANHLIPENLPVLHIKHPVCLKCNPLIVCNQNDRLVEPTVGLLQQTDNLLTVFPIQIPGRFIA